MPTTVIPSRRVSLSVSAPFLDQAPNDATPATAVYAFSAGGALLGQTRLDGGRGELDVSVGQEAAGVRLLAGPVTDDKEPALDELLRRGAQEQHLRIEARTEKLAVELALPAEIWRVWLGNRCTVKGTLHKRMARDGVTIDYPVCSATVEIYEVDPIRIVVPKLPKHLLDKLREVIVRPIPRPEPVIDLPDLGGPFPGPAPFARTMMARASSSQSSEAHRVDADAIASMHSASGSSALRFAAMSASDLAFRQSLIDNAVLVRPLLCWLHPTLVTMRRIGTATTDACGHFRTTIHKSIFNPDQPDLYFKARQRLGGFFDVTIHAPTPIACHTWWDYVCGTEVKLYTSHPLAMTCAPCPPVIAGPNWVLFMAIGNHPLSRIHGIGPALGAVTAQNRGLTDGGAPFGGTLRPRLEFDNALRDSLGVHCYRLSWKRESESTFKPMTAAVNRHYAYMVGLDLVADAYLLGPQTRGGESNLFEIPPSVPPLGQWTLPELVSSTESGQFDTVAADGTALLDQMVQVRVELFDADGLAVDIAGRGINYFAPTSLDLTGTVQTQSAASLGLVDGNTMVITLHINNERCTAEIAGPTLNGGAVADDCCGVLHYSPGQSVTMNWTASHPHGFATYSFGVVRGVSGVYGSSGPVAPVAFSATRTVGQLLSDNLPAHCTDGPCTVAGFAENLYVATTATDGWGRLSGYDASDVRAFVLSPT